MSGPRLAGLLLLAVVLGACGGSPERAGAVEAGRSAPPAQQELVVFAAASLTDAFGDLAEAFQQANPGVTVQVSFGGSSSLREQILAGAPAGVFASADSANMDRLVQAGAAGQRRTFARNRLQIAVPAGNPAGVEDITDLADPDLLIGLCAPEVPCGELARRAFEAAGVTPSVDTEEPDVRALLTKVQAGELDAGIVYRTDVKAAGRAVEGVDIPEAAEVIATYPIAVLPAASDPELAEAFVDFVLSDQGQAVLGRHGFDAADDAGT